MLSDKECANKLADHFSQISQTFEPLHIEKLPNNVKAKIKEGISARDKPYLEEYEVYNKLKSIKKPNSKVDGDIPKKLLVELMPEFTVPITVMFNKITESTQYPNDWKREEQIPIGKVSSPESEDEIRNLSKTKFLSKLYEGFLCDWLLPQVQPYLDPHQYGGMKGSSVNHYLVKLLNFIHKGLNMRDPQAVILACLDLSKAYNRGSASIALVDLFDMHVSPFLLAIIASYMQNRSMVLIFNGVCSEVKKMPGSFSQGCYLFMILFIIQFNGALLRPQVPRCICEQSEKVCLESRKNIQAKLKQNRLNFSQGMTCKFIDDCCTSYSISLKEGLELVSEPYPKPVTYNQRTGHKMKQNHNQIQMRVNEFCDFTDKNKFVINKKKCEAMVFNPSQNFAFPPDISVNNSTIINEVSSIKLFGLIIQ